MLFTINLPERQDALAINRQRWAEISSDRQWSDHPYRIETNAFGQIIMTPPPRGAHRSRQGEIAFQLRLSLGGHAMPECPVSTVDGVKAVDVGWYSSQRYSQVRGQLVFELAPEVCVEVLNPSNTAAEMQTKRQLYFEAGAIECWTCDSDGQMTYFHIDAPEQPSGESQLCPSFPPIIQD